MATETKSYIFTQDGGAQVVNGKVYYPNHLFVAFASQRDALLAAESILRQATSVQIDDGETGINLVLFGKLQEDEE